jgi:PTH1 family peptidyl-tRNA hydrolase
VKLIVGLGNPGPRYAATRHNVGFQIVERFAARRGTALRERRFRGRFGTPRIGSVEVAVLEPLTYMNLSGRSVLEAVRELPVEDPSQDLIVVLDDVDLPFGRLRIRPGGGAGGHKGLADVIARLRRDDFARLRFGVGRPAPGLDTADYVLEPFAPEEEAELEGRLEAAVQALDDILAEGVTAAMNRHNVRAPGCAEAAAERR